MYQTLIRPLLFQLDPETAHDLFRAVGRISGSLPLAKLIDRLPSPTWSRASNLIREVGGIKFPNSVGLAAGFDKNCELVPILSRLGFGAIELGTVTLKPQAGNPRPRIFRLPQHQAIINRMGFPSLGVETFLRNLALTRERLTNLPIFGVNIGKNKDTPLEEAWKEYRSLAERVAPLADYIVVNVSSPNTPALRALQHGEELRRIIGGVRDAAGTKPVFLKIAPDLTEPEVLDIVNSCISEGANGIIATNTTLTRPAPIVSEEAGGLSGSPIFSISKGIVESVGRISAGRLGVIASGGINSPQRASEMFAIGANIVQIYSALIYSGSGLIKEICLAGERNE